MKYKVIRCGKDSYPELNGNSFVGVAGTDGISGNISIVVPVGTECDGEVDDSDIRQKEQYRFLRRYVKAVQKALSSNHVKERLENTAGIHNPAAAVNLLHDYLSIGKFVEFEVVSGLSECGKIDFGQTIRKVRPKASEGNIFFDKFISRKRVVQEDNFIATVQCNVINHFMRHGGAMLFGQSVSTPVRGIRLDRQTITELRKELNNTFNSRKENIIQWCIEYIDGVCGLDESDTTDGNWQYAIIASTLWEVMVDSVLGNQPYRDKTLYGKTYEFTYFDGHSMRGNATQHDTIYEDDETLIIIDAKMYRYTEHLLSENVLGKQFGYYEQAKMMKRQAGEQKRIINILVLPQTEFSGSYFQNKIILDPHTTASEDPFKIIFLYNYPVNNLIDDYYFGRKKYNVLIDHFRNFIQDPAVSLFLEQRGCDYKF